GTIAVGADADLVVWDATARTIRNTDLHHAVDYTPYEGIEVKAWPALTLSRGDIVWDGREFHPRAGRGEFLRRGRPTLLPARPTRTRR
ncbi:MAG TPA: dihydropyrimidinase, partial [Burkholderiaceae bacterium]|nr:dihydropyrimidinase [Burkholderiaceae bacterium]